MTDPARDVAARVAVASAVVNFIEVLSLRLNYYSGQNTVGFKAKFSGNNNFNFRAGKKLFNKMIIVIVLNFFQIGEGNSITREKEPYSSLLDSACWSYKLRFSAQTDHLREIGRPEVKPAGCEV